MTLHLPATQRELARQLEEAVAAVMEVIARKDERILRLEQESAILRQMLCEARVTCHEKQEPKG